MNNLFKVLAGLIDLLKSYGRKKEQENAQKDADLIESDPAAWYAKHFRVQRNTESTKSSSNKTDTE